MNLPTAPSSPTARVLVVDDEKLIRWSVAERLQRSGYEVVSAETGEQALELLSGAAPDLVLLDVRLPGIDGVETLQRALSIHPELAVLMMSAHSTVDIAVEESERFDNIRKIQVPVQAALKNPEAIFAKI